ncbi:MAG: radical SAM protein [Candidatus Marinimicrobia bacterium]|jgi:wyosine [tRNA(Phe)-imidazoG37] synthetase (radical SAM superfamily)|nr:radical SAM protein [Candidatus Neomarinimicrobiota bacterium]
MYKYLFGPVPSRRLGMSLGIDLIPTKVCSLNCVYCECGKTTNLTIERKEYVPYNKVTNELEHYFKNNPTPDYVTFSGSGEPTLNSKIGDISKFLKLNYPYIPIAVLTNGTLFDQKEVRTELLDADLVLPSLDAASELSFKKINRPFHTLNIDKYIQGLIDFRKEYSGKIWLEVLILPGYNDNKKDLKLLKDAFVKIKPDKIQLNSLDRPGILNTLRSATRNELQQIADFLNLDNVEIIASAPKRKEIKSYRKDTETAILETIFRRPCTLDDLSEILGLHKNEINKYLDVLESDDKIEIIRQSRGIFYKIKK